MIAFDFDLTIADTSDADQHVFEATVEKFSGGISADFNQKLRELSGRRLDDILIGLAIPRQQLDFAREFFISSYPQIGVSKVKFMFGAEKLLAQLQDNSLGFAIVSAKTHSNLVLAVEALGIKPVKCFGGLHGAGKTEVLQEINARVYVGDQLSDVLSGRNAGCRTVLITSNPEDVNDWVIKPDFCFSSLAELPINLLEGL